MFKHVVIVGVGLIGGSFALGLKAAGLAQRITGVGRGAANLKRAVELGVIDDIAADESVYGDADFILIATPVGQMAKIMVQIAPLLKAGAVVTDGGSTKVDVAALARAHFGDKLAQFVPAHPIAGAELSGVEAARIGLYQGKKVVIAALPETAPEAAAKVRTAWEACGARIFEMAPAQHDATFATVSHLPHLLAFALVDDIAERPEADLLFQYAASGFRDFTRIAGSSVEMWRDIAVANRTALLTEMDAYMAALTRMRAMLAAGDGDALAAVFANARQAREAWLASIEKNEPPAPKDHEA
ncbi:MAG TPA: prephenate dehydrogenase/arogenate dehydrogenase family protein [Burkholderiales bacterium]|nr:prephenate dehydrogenase/arogenate dehydrogenase family protein [Burkholderiales bacterium]